MKQLIKVELDWMIIRKNLLTEIKRETKTFNNKAKEFIVQMKIQAYLIAHLKVLNYKKRKRMIVKQIKSL